MRCSPAQAAIGSLLIVTLMAPLCLIGSVQAESIWALSYNYSGSPTSHIWQWDTSTGIITQMGTVPGHMYVSSLADSGKHLYVAGWSTGWDWEILKLNRGTMAVESVVSKSAVMPADGTNITNSLEWIDGRLYALAGNNGSGGAGGPPGGLIYQLSLGANGDILGSTPGVDMWAVEDNCQSNAGYLTKNPASGMIYAGPEGNKWQVKTADIMAGPLDPIRGYIYDQLDYISSGVFDSTGAFYCADFRYGKIYTGTPDNPSQSGGHISLLYDLSTAIAGAGDTGFADFAPVHPAVLSLDSSASCVQPGQQITVSVLQSGLLKPAAGFQAFLSYDTGALSYSSGSLTTSPYGLAVLPLAESSPGNIDMATGINVGQPPTTSDAVLADLVFTAGTVDGPTTVSFRTQWPPSRLSDDQGNEIPTLKLNTTFLVDGTPPSITCPPDATVECDESTDPSNTGSATATDNLDPAPVITHADALSTAITPASMDGWSFLVTQAMSNNPGGDGTGELVNGPAAPPMGLGSAHLLVPSGNGDESVQLRNNAWAGTRIDQLTTLKYSTYVTAWNGQQAPYVTIFLDTDGDNIRDDRLWFEPAYSEAGAGNGNPNPQPNVALNTWQTWDLLEGMWYSDNVGGPGSNAITLAAYLAQKPNATIINEGPGGIRIAIGFASPGDEFNSYVDGFVIGTASGTTVYDFELASGCANQTIVRTWTATDCAGNSSSCDQTITVQDTTPPEITYCPPHVTIECDASNPPGVVPGVLLGTAQGGILVAYNGGQPESPDNQAYMRAQFTQANSNGAVFNFDNTILPPCNLGSFYDLFQVHADQFGLDMVLPAPTWDTLTPIPPLTAVDNTNGSCAGAAAAGPVTWAISGYIPSPSQAGGCMVNSLFRSASPPTAQDVELTKFELSLSGTVYTAEVAGVLNSDGIIHWYTPATPDGPMSNFGLNGDFYFEGTLTYDSAGDPGNDGDFYAGTINLYANSPYTVGVPQATDNCDQCFNLIPNYDDEVDDSDPCAKVITRTWTFTDSCGNESEPCVQMITIQDTTPPAITNGGPIGDCYVDQASAEAAAIAATTASDTCSDVTLSASTVGDCSATITVTATDACGLTASTTYTTRIDGTPPVIACPDDITVNADAASCEWEPNRTEPFDVAPTLAATQTPGAWYTDRYAPNAFESVVFDGDNRLRLAISSADSAANRPPGYTSTFYSTQGRKYDVGLPIGSTIAVDIYIPSDWATNVRYAHMWATTFDAAGNVSGYPIIGFTSNDPADPMNTSPASPTPRFRIYTQDTDQNPGNGYQAGYVDLGLPPGFVYDEWYTVSVKLTDAAYEFSVTGGTSPLTYNDAITYGSVQFGNVMLQGYNYGESYDVYYDNVTTGPGVGAAVATDNCTDVVALSASRDDNLGLNEPYPVGPTTITWTAEDECGNTETCVQTVTVNDTTTAVVDIELATVAEAGPVTRCIQLQFGGSGGTAAPVTRDVNVTFTNGLGQAVVDDLPACVDWTCVTAKDRKHTLLRNVALGVNGAVHEASFTGADALQGGDFTDDNLIDILDFGVFAGQYGVNVGADTLCDYVLRHADASCNGVVGTEDFTFIYSGFLEVGEDICGNAVSLASVAEPKQSVTLAELARIVGIPAAIKADLNSDRKIDQKDIALFFKGKRGR